MPLPRFDPVSGKPMWDPVTGKPMVGCGCCAPGCACTSATLCPAFADCTPCSITLTFTYDGGCFGPLSTGAWPTGGTGSPYVGNDPDQQNYVSITGPSVPLCVVKQPEATCGWAISDTVVGAIQFTINGCDTVPHLFSPVDGSDLGAMPASDGAASIGFTYLAPDAFNPAGVTTINVQYAYVNTSLSGSAYAGFNGIATIAHALTSADFPLTVNNTDGTGAGSVVLSLDCCGTCNDCPEDSLSADTPLGLCCSHFAISIAGLTTDFTHGWDVYVNYDTVPTPTLIDGWQSADQQAHVYCSGGKWFIRITDKCNELGLGSAKYIEWQSDIRECPSLRPADWTVIHNDFGGTPVLSILAYPGCTGQCPSACNECCGTYHATLADSGCSSLNTTFDLVRNGTACSWQYLASPATSIFCDSVNNRWLARFYGTLAACGVDGYIEFNAPMFDNVGGDQKRCPLTDTTQWECTHNDFGPTTVIAGEGGLTPPTLSITTSDCGCVTPICPTDCSACQSCFVMVVSSDSDPYGINGTYTFTIEVDSCNWTDGTNDLTCNDGVWSMTFRPSVPASLVVVFTAAVDDSGCPPVNNDTTWTFASCTPGEGATCPDPDPTYALGFESCP